MNLLLCVALFVTQPPASTVEEDLSKLESLIKQRNELTKEINQSSTAVQKKINDLNKRFKDVTGQNTDPVVPIPNDPLKDKLEAAYKADSENTVKKRTVLLSLSGFYAQLGTPAFMNDETMRTVGEMAKRIEDIRKDIGLTDNDLPGFRTIVSQELSSMFSSLDQKLTEDNRKKAQALFTRVKTAIDTILSTN